MVGGSWKRDAESEEADPMVFPVATLIKSKLGWHPTENPLRATM